MGVGLSKDGAAPSSYAKFGFRSLKDDRLDMFLPMETAPQAIGKTRIKLSVARARRSVPSQRRYSAFQRGWALTSNEL